jgi:hypothetical protein
VMIDTHQHVFWHGRNDADLVADMDAFGIQQAWLLSWEVAPSEDERSYHGVLNPLHVRPDGTHAGIPLPDLLLTRDRYPDRFVVGYCPHPLLPEAPRLQLRCPVVLHLDVPYLPDPETARPIYQRNWYGGTVANLERALASCPETTFIGHAPGFWREISGDADTDPKAYPAGPIREGGRLLPLFGSYSNLYADLSAGSALGALKRDPGHARDFLCRFADRLLFGRDYYGGDLLEFLQSLDLPSSVQEQIYYRNAQRLLAGTE